MSKPKKKATTKNGKTKLCSVVNCSAPAVVRIDGERLCKSHADKRIREMNEHVSTTEDHKIPRVHKAKAIQDDFDLRSLFMR